MSLPSIPLAPGRKAPPCETEVCSQCCHDIEMVLTEADVERLGPAARRLEIAKWYFVAPDGFLQLRTQDAPPARRSPGGQPCVFLKPDGLCGVWEDRPEGCRVYPAVWDEGLREATFDVDYCPHTDGFQIPTALSDVTRRLVARLHAERDARG